MKILVTGATGTIGRPLCAHLLSSGYAVAALTRNKETAFEKVHARSHIVQWDLSPSTPKMENFELNDWTKQCGEIDAVINLAGEPLVGKRWSKAQKDRLYYSRINATRAIVTAIQEKRIKPHTLLNASAIGYYDYDSEKSFTEDDGPGSSYLSKLCEDWEAEAKKAESYGVRVVQLRTGIVLSRDGGTIKQMLPAFKMFLGGYFGNGSYAFSWIHIEDVIRAISFILENKEINGPINIVSPNHSTNKEFVKAVGKALGRPAVLSIPYFAVWLRFGEMADILYNSQIIKPHRLLEKGFSFRYSDLSKAVDNILIKKVD